MKMIVFLIGVILIFGGLFVYGQESTSTQSAAQSQEGKTFDESLEKRAEEAVSNMETYGEEVQKEIEPIKDSKEQQKKFFSKLGEYISHHVRNNSIKELLVLEAQVLKKGEGPDTIYGWFFVTVHNMVLKLAGYDPDSDIPITGKILEIIQDKSIDDYVRSKYVISIQTKLNNLHNQRKIIDTATKTKVMNTMSSIYNDKGNDSELRKWALITILMGDRGGNLANATVLDALRESDAKIQIEAVRFLDITKADDKVTEELISMLQHHKDYSDGLVNEIVKNLSVKKDKRAIPYMLDRLNKTTDVEKFKTTALLLQSFGEPSVMEEIIKKFKELKLENPHESYYYLENKLLLDYLPMSKKEDKLFILRLIFQTSHQIGGNVEIPHHYDKAIAVLKSELLNEDKQIRLIATDIYWKMTDAIKYETLDSIKKDKIKLTEEIKKALLEAKKNETDEEILKLNESIIQKIAESNEINNEETLQ